MKYILVVLFILILITMIVIKTYFEVKGTLIVSLVASRTASYVAAGTVATEIGKEQISEKHLPLVNPQLYKFYKLYLLVSVYYSSRAIYKFHLALFCSSHKNTLFNHNAFLYTICRRQ